MSLSDSRWIVSTMLIGIALTGCGGGSGYSGGMMASSGGSGGGSYGGGTTPTPTPMAPTVAFSSPAANESINFGQDVSLAWTSTNADSCMATASSSVGGAFAGSQPMSGNAVVAPVGTGTVMYTLTCTGSGGTASATTPAVTVNPSILSTLSATKIAAVGSTVDPVEHGGNPYGLTIAQATAGLITKGDLIACNFNDGATNTQGHGTTVIGLHPSTGATPYHIAQSASLEGCNALAAFPDGSVSAAAFTSNAVPLIAATGAVANPFSAGTGGFGGPWGQAYVAATSQRDAALYLSNLSGSIIRIGLSGDTQTATTILATGFCGSGTPGAIYAPAGLTYDPSIDTLYVVDTSSYSVVALANVSSIVANGIVVSGQCGSVTAPPTPVPTFSGPSAASARVIAHGGGFIAPLSAALLSDGDLVVANADVNIASGQMPNLIFEISPVLPGGFVGQPLQVDTSGTPGALFGIVATVDGQGNQVVYFNDDNTNSVMMLTK